MVEEVRASISQDVVDALCEHRFVSKITDNACDVVVVRQFGVAENFGLLPEKVGDYAVMPSRLGYEFLAIVQEDQAMVVGFGDELDASGFRERLEALDDIRAPFLELFDHGPGKRVA